MASVSVCCLSRSSVVLGFASCAGISVVFLGAFPQASAPLISPLGSAHVVPPSGKTEKCCKAGSLNFFLSGEIADFVGLI